MEVPIVNGPGNPLKRDDSGAEVERFAKDFEELQKKISDTDEKERSRKRHQQEQVEEIKRKSTSAVHEQRELSPSPMIDAGFSKVVSKHSPHTVSSNAIPNANVDEAASSSLQFTHDESVQSTEEASTSKAEEASETTSPQAPSKLHEKTTSGLTAAAEEKTPEVSPQEFEHTVDEVLNSAPLIEEKLGKEGEVEQASFTPEKNQSNLSSVTQATGPTPYTRLTPEMMEMFDNLILHMQVMEESDVRETTFTLGGKAFEGSVLHGSKIIIREYQKSAPLQYNIEFEGSPEAIEKLSKKMDALTLALTHGNYSFKVHRFETRISTKNLGSERSPSDEEELT